MSEIRLLVDAASVSSPGGEVLQIELNAALDRTCPEGARGLVLRRSDQTGIGEFSHLDCEVGAEGFANGWQKWVWVHRRLPSWVRRFSPTVVLAMGGVAAPRLSGHCGLVVTCNNMVPFLRLDEMPESTTWATKLRLLASRRLVVKSLERADRVVLHSEQSLETLSGFAAGLRSKSRVVLTGVPRRARLEELPTRPPHPYDGRSYFLYFSVVRWFKNHLRLIEAYRLLAQSIDDLPDLLLVGYCRDAAYLDQIEAAIAAASLGERIRYLGAVADSDVASWLHHATINVFPSLTETNSVIQAEILGLHGVMAAAARSPMTEVADRAAVYFDPLDPADIARVLADLWRDAARREEFRGLAAQRAHEFSWDACGRAMWQAAAAASELHRSRNASSFPS